MKRSTVDLVVTGEASAAVAAAVDAVRLGQRVLVVLRSDDARVVPRLRRLCRAAQSQLMVMTKAEVVCVDGVDGVEAVVVRYTRTGRLCAVNTSAFLSCDGSTHPPRARIGGMDLEIREIERERGEMLETGWELNERESNSEKVIAGLRVRDSRGPRIDRKLLS